MVSGEDTEFSSELLSFEDTDEKLSVNKRIVVSGDNLINATPKVDNQTNQALVSFTFDRVGAKKFGRATTDNVGKRLAIILDGKLIAAVEEERFTRIKHTAGFPSNAVRYCLQQAGIKIQDVSYVAIPRKRSAQLFRKLFWAVKTPGFAIM